MAGSSPSDSTAILGAIEHLLALREHPGWKILMARLDAERANAQEALVDVDPTDWREVAKGQDAARRLHWYQESVEELLLEGLQSEGIGATGKFIDD
jgi:hypothetical protein